MNDDLELRLRDDLRGTVLPAAPASLRDYLTELPAREAAPRPRSIRAPHLLLAAAVALLVVTLGTGLLMSGAVGPTPTARPSASETAAPSSSPSPAAADVDQFSVPGISLHMADGWSDQSSAIEYPSLPGQRYVGYLVSGMQYCHTRMYSTAPPTPKPTGCDDIAAQPGTATLAIMELMHQLPSTHGGGEPLADTPYPTWGPPSGSDQPEWTVQSPDGGLYVMTLIAPQAELDARRAQVSSMLKSLQLSAWEATPKVVDGRIHVDTGRGFSFDYPAGWTIYWPEDISMMDSAVVTVASGPLEPPCPDSCQRFSTPAATVAVEFRIGGGLGQPDWSNAPTTIGGQPAFREDWGPQNATRAEEGQSWNVRLTDSSELGIYASLKGPDLPSLRSSMDEVLDSVRIPPK